MRGAIVIEADPHQDPDEIALAAIDAGAEDVKVEGRRVEVYASPSQLSSLRRSCKGAVTRWPPPR